MYGQQQSTHNYNNQPQEADMRISAAKQEPAILVGLNELEGGLHRLHETIGLLESRLSSVLCPMVEEKTRDVGRDHRGGSVMTHSLANLSGMVDAAGARVRRIMDGLEL